MLAALARLTPYDLEGDRTVQALKEIGEQAAQLGPRRAAEYHFLHAVASVDLLVAAQLLHDDDLARRVAEANGGSLERARALLAAELSDVDKGVLHETAADCLAALRLMGGAAERDPRAWHSRTGSRHDLLFLAEVRRRTRSEGDPIGALAPLATDPCAAQGSCEAFPYLTSTARRAATALERAAQVALALQQGASEDPLLKALGPHVGSLDDLAALELRPVPSMKAAPPVAVTADGGPGQVPDLMVFVTPSEVRYSLAPRLRLDERGRLRAMEADGPVFPATQRVPMPASYPPFLRPISAVQDALAPLAAKHPDARAAVSASPDVPAHVWGRVLLTARVAGFKTPALLARAADGSPRVLPLDVFTAHQAAKAGPREVTVMVRLGGYSVKRNGPSVLIPKLQVESGWKFDLDALRQRAPAARVRSAKLHFMPNVASATLHATAFAVAPKGKRLAVILP